MKVDFKELALSPTKAQKRFLLLAVLSPRLAFKKNMLILKIKDLAELILKTKDLC